MILVKTPLRVNFLGGGSDFEDVFLKQGGAVFGTTINLYVYINAALIPPFAEERYRFTYRKSESVGVPEDFEHPVVRQILSENRAIPPLNLATMADVPGNSGLGSSSAFTVGLLKLLATIENRETQASNLALEAIRIERLELKEAGGWQDQFHASHGGLTLYIFNRDKTVETQEVPAQSNVIDLLNRSMLLIPLGGQRLSTELAKNYIENLDKPEYLHSIEENSDLAKEVAKVFLDANVEPQIKLDLLGVAMRRAWEIKLKTNDESHLEQANILVKKAISAGASAAKLCGAGESGFIFILHSPEKKQQILESLDAHTSYSPKISYGGATLEYAGSEEPEITLDTWNNARASDY